MTVYIIAGTNGSGKSTFLANSIRSGFIPRVEYVCQGFHNANFFSESDTVVMSPKKLRQFHLHKRLRLFNERKPMIIEHALADRELFAFLKKCRKAGYRIVSIYITTPSPTVNIRNVKKRVSQGGHGCTAAKTLMRYYVAKLNYGSLKRFSDEIYIYEIADSFIFKKAIIDNEVYK